MNKKIRSHNGFTLVEIIVSLGILVAIIALTSNVILSSMKMYNRDNDITQAKYMGDVVLDHMVGNLRYATALSIVDEEKNLGENPNQYAMQVIGGELNEWKTDKPSEKNNTYTEQYYRGMTITTYSKVLLSKDKTIKIGENDVSQNQWLSIRIEVKSANGKLLYNTEKTTELINISANIESAELGKTFAEKNLRIVGNLATASESENAIFCYDAKKVNNRADYTTSPAEMYWQVDAFLKLDTTLRKEEFAKYGLNQNLIDSNDEIRRYILARYYDGEWPLLSGYIDISRYRFNDASFNRQPNTSSLADIVARWNKLLEQEVRLNFHYDNTSKSVLIYATEGGTNWWSPCFIYVPDSAEQFSNGYWYTHLPTTSTTTDMSDPGYDEGKLNISSSYNNYSTLITLAASPRHGYNLNGTFVKSTTYVIKLRNLIRGTYEPKNGDEFYDIYREYWSPLK